MSSRHSMQRDYSAKELGLSAKSDLSGGADATSPVDCTGFNQISWFIFLDRGNGTSLTFKVEVSNDNSTYFVLQAAAVSSGVATLTPIVYTKATSADKKIVVDMPVNYKYVKLTTITGGSTDAITVTARLGKI
tara:strand:+ start:1001 stop:1399 length:399 start_codon:yes stop_codon:yes gene_type:complete